MATHLGTRSRDLRKSAKLADYLWNGTSVRRNIMTLQGNCETVLWISQSSWEMGITAVR